MAIAVGNGRAGAKSEINVTPLVDVVLVLLIIFMVVTPQLRPGKDVKLPPAPGTKDAPTPALVVSVTAQREVFVDAATQPAGGALEAQLAQALREQPGRRIVVKGDRSLSYGEVRSVMRTSRDAGAKGVALAVDPSAGERR